MRVRSTLAWGLALGAVGSHAQFLLGDLSFGFGARINPENSQSIPNFSLQGNPNLPELLSNKIILTPPAPGNQRGAVWSDKSLDYEEWAVDVNFRVNGPERTGGNVNIWLARDGPHDVGAGSIYTVGRFEGLALVIDTYGGSAGIIRGFLNDGTTDYKSSHIDGLSFAHCNYAYRNLGRPSQVKISQTDTMFRVEVDGSPCFSSDRVQIPPGYRLGVTAASAENPDSVEVFKLVVLTEKHEPNQGSGGQQQQQQSQQNQQQQQQQQQQGGDNGQKKAKTPSRFARSPAAGDRIGGSDHHEGAHWEQGGWEEDIPDEEATRFTSSKAQFEDLHNRLQSVNHHLSTIFRQVSQQASVDERRHEETSSMIHDVKLALTKLSDLDARMQSLERELRTIRTDLSHKVQATENNIRSMVDNTHINLVKKVKDHAAPGHGRLIFVILGSQAVLIVAFLLYKRRKNSLPKKYL